jgi:glutathione S-transferase
MALKIYGVARSRTARVLWMAKELGLDYEHVKVDFATGETRQPAHLALNPNGHVPVIDDDGVILWESMAINLISPRNTVPAGSIRTASRTRRGLCNGASGP